MKQTLRTDLTAAMKNRDELRKQTLRMMLAAVQAEEVAGKTARELTDEQILAVLTKEAKKRAESATVYADAGRAELADKERAEAEIISGYLPVQLSDEELGELANEAVGDVARALGEPPTMRQMGQIVAAVRAKAAGRADGARISAAVKARL